MPGFLVAPQTKDCNVVASKLMFLLDDLLWVLTDSQLKAMMKYAESLSEAMEKSAQQRKSLAPEPAQVGDEVDALDGAGDMAGLGQPALGRSVAAGCS